MAEECGARAQINYGLRAASRPVVACGRACYFPEVIVLVLASLIVGDRAIAEDFIRLEVTNEAPLGWKRLEEFASHIDASGTMRFESEGIEGAPPTRLESWEFLARGSLIKAVNRRPPPDGNGDTERGFVIGDRYHFAVQKEAEGPWLIRYVGPVRREIDAVLTEGVLRFISAPWAIAGRRLRDSVAAEGFSITEASEEINDRGKRLIAISFTNGPSEIARTGVQSGRLVLDPSMFWAVQTADLTGTGSLLQRVIVRYAKESTDKPILAFVSAARLARDGPEKQELSFAFDKYIYREIPTEEFTLESFGIDPKRDASDPPSAASETPISTRSLLLVAGFLLLSVAFLLYRKSRQRRA